MKRINRDAIQRMVDARGGKAGGTSGGGGGSLAGYATQAWVNEGFVSVEFFNRLFTVYGPGETSSDPDVVIEPNDLDSTIKNIKAMFGLWTEQYLSALGLNPGGTGSATSLGMLDDVSITTPTNGQALVYNSTSMKWENQTISTVTALANLTDVLLTSPADGQTLLYDGTNAKWYNSALKTINGQSLLGSGDISVGGGASGNYLPLSGGTLTNALPTSSGILNITATSGSYSWQYSIMCLYSGLTTNTRNGIVLGKSFSSQNCGIITYYQASSADNNTFSFGFHSVNDLFNLYAGGRVGIGVDSGQTPYGKMEIYGQSGDGLPILHLNATSADDTYNYAMSAVNSSLTGGKYYAIILGKSMSTYNTGIISYRHAGDSSQGNYMSISFYNSGRLLNVFANGRVGINTEQPDSMFHVNGDGIFDLATQPSNHGILSIYSQSGENNFSYSLSAFCRSLASGYRNGITFGKIFSSRNTAVITYYHAGDGSTSNFIGFGLHSVDDVLTVCASGRVGVKTSSPSYELHVAGSIYATGAITALSDIKQKNVEQYDAHLGFDEVANAPVIKFTWKDPKADNKGLHVGSIAQYWEKVLPEAVKKDKEGTLSMSYGVVALVAAISTAKKVQEHERRIAELERENKDLKGRLRRLNRYGEQ